jgi:hypothetical protein
VLTAIAYGKPNHIVLPLGLLIAFAASWYVVFRPLLRARRDEQRIQLSPAGIRVARRSPGWHASGVLAADQIEDLIVSTNHGLWQEGMCVVARGDAQRLPFGHGLDHDDAIWLRDTAIAALAPRGVYR